RIIQFYSVNLPRALSISKPAARTARGVLAIRPCGGLLFRAQPSLPTRFAQNSAGDQKFSLASLDESVTITHAGRSASLKPCGRPRLPGAARHLLPFVCAHAVGRV